MTTHTTGARVIGNHADMGSHQPKVDQVHDGDRGVGVTLLDIVRAGKRRRAGQLDDDCAESRWRSEGGAGRRP